MPSPPDQQALHDEIADLEQRLRAAKAQLQPPPTPPHHTDPSLSTHLPALLLLADSALPLGSFAFSSGLESYLAHHKHTHPPSASQLPLLTTFLRLSLASLASTALPYVLAAYREPQHLERWDDEFDASTPCTVARRASVAQGRALLAVWERSFRAQSLVDQDNNDDSNESKEREEGEKRRSAAHTLSTFSAALRSNPSLHAHYPPLWGLVSLLLRLPLRAAAYIFLFAHARTVISAAVRASVLGPYQAQSLLAGGELRTRIERLVDEGWCTSVDEAGQCVPGVDLWVGRHEALYSRIFNS